MASQSTTKNKFTEFAVKIARLKVEAGELGLFETMQAIEIPLKKVGWEIAYLLDRSTVYMLDVPGYSKKVKGPFQKPRQVIVKGYEGKLAHSTYGDTARQNFRQAMKFVRDKKKFNMTHNFKQFCKDNGIELPEPKL